MDSLDPQRDQTHWMESLLPRNPTMVHYLCRDAGTLSQGGIIDRHILAPSYFGTATLVAYIQVPVLLVHGTSSFLTGIVCCDLGKGSWELAADVADAFKSLVFAAIGTFYIFATLFFPGTFLGSFATMNIIEPDLEADIADLEETLQQKEQELAALNVQRQDLRNLNEEAKGRLKGQEAIADALQGELEQKDQELEQLRVEIAELKNKAAEGSSSPSIPIIETPPAEIIEPKKETGEGSSTAGAPENPPLDELPETFKVRCSLQLLMGQKKDLQNLERSAKGTHLEMIRSIIQILEDVLVKKMDRLEFTYKMNGIESALILDLIKSDDLDQLVNYITRTTVQLEKAIKKEATQVELEAEDVGKGKEKDGIDGERQTLGALDHWVTEHNHVSKGLKYHHVLTQVQQKMADEGIDLETEFKTLECLKDRNPLFTNAYEVVKILTHPELCTGDARELARLFVVHLRLALASDEYMEFRVNNGLKEAEAVHAAQLMRTVCYVRFAKVVLYPYLEEVITLGAGAPHETLKPGNFWETFHEKNEALHHLDPQLGKPRLAKMLQQLEGHLGVNFDPVAGVNTPYLRSEWTFVHEETGKTAHVDCLRHGTPTEEGGIATAIAQRVGGYFFDFDLRRAVVIPEYRAYIEESKKREEKIFHFVHEKRKKLGMFKGDESDRVRAKMELGVLHSGHYTPLAFPMDGDFFKWGGLFVPGIRNTSVTSYKDLKRVFVEQMFDPDSDFQLPERLNTEEFKAEVKVLADTVHANFFNNAPGAISTRDRYQAFQLLLQAHIKFHLLFRDLDKNKDAHLHIKSICKDCIDRGNIAEAIQELYLLLMLGREEDAADLYELLINTLAPPHVVKKQGVLEDRAVFLKYVCEIIFKLSDEKKAAIRAQTFKGWKPAGFAVPKAADQKGIYERQLGAIKPQDYNGLIQGIISEKGGTKRIEVKDDVVKANAAPYMENGKISRQKIRDEVKNIDLLEPLKRLSGNNEDRAYTLLCSCQPAAAGDLFHILQRMFDHPSLGMKVQESMDEPVCSVDRDGIRIVQQYALADKEGMPHANIEGVTTIDAKTGYPTHTFAIRDFQPLTPSS